MLNQIIKYSNINSNMSYKYYLSCDENKKNLLNNYSNQMIDKKYLFNVQLLIVTHNFTFTNLKITSM